MSMNLGRLFTGLALIVVGLALISLSNISTTSYGALVLIGPFPILVASDFATAIFLLLIAVVFIVLASLIRWWG